MRYLVVVVVSLLALLSIESTSYASTATIGSITLTPGGERIEIQGDQPLTWLYRKMSEGTGILLDVAPGRIRGVAGVIPGAGVVTGIRVMELQVEGISVTRLLIGMKKEAVVNVTRDPADAGRIVVRFPALAPPDATVPGDPVLTELLVPDKAEIKGAVDSQKQTGDSAAPATLSKTPDPVKPLDISQKQAALPVPVPVVTPPSPLPTSTVPPPSTSRPVLSSIVVNRDSLELLTGTPSPRYDSFRLSSPERLVIDLPGAGLSTSSREIRVGQFGVSRVRVGAYPDKVRLVFDADSKNGLPLSVIQKTSKGLKITFASTGRSK